MALTPEFETRATLVEGECSHRYTILAPKETKLDSSSKLLGRPRLLTGFFFSFSRPQPNVNSETFQSDQKLIAHYAYSNADVN